VRTETCCEVVTNNINKTYSYDCWCIVLSDPYVYFLRVIPSCFRFAYMCLCQVSLLSSCSSRYLISFSWGSCTLFIGPRIRLFLRNEYCVKLLVSVTFQSSFLNQFWIASRLICSFCEGMAGSFSMAAAAVTSAKVAVVDSGEVCMSEVYSRYNNGPRTLLWCTSALTLESSVY
jgi:hypothetical protein